METVSRSRADIALPNPQELPSEPGIELSEVPSHEDTQPGRTVRSPPRQTWLTFLKKELEFLGVTQILIALICFCFGIIVYSMLKISGFEKDFFSSFKAGYPFWGAVFFAISGFLSVMSEKNHAAYLVHGSLGANLVSSIAAVAGFIILIANLKNSLAYISFCQEASVDDFCSAVFFSTEIVATILFLTILGFGAAVALTVYRVGELFKRDKSLEERLYEELNIYSPIYSELEALPPTDT
ncbi:high affinity immunoglobulin epsilon receptor subunit beta [Rousettus aegyptiacus]|uniref:Membrane spanning 4-domains A2 n=1 Tax=Rousettus aegyptiacus TaxID=9407 RepID=A0A7J8H2C1_ROUAE|nr:high affinity immunoglobulin epsilon receptor subunit beta [Rousettus aegyptiacus]KAF6466464.1 membrane spanning 4-domains A2 [Rousettus aegyptiacus]